MQLTIEKVKPTAKSLVLTAGGKEYFAKKETGITAGMTIEAELKASDYNGKTYTWVERYKPVNGSAAPQAAPAASGHAAGAPAGAAPIWLQMASNTVAHALNAGVLKEPSDIKAWVLAVKSAVEGGPDA
jgi:hypothetical protein